jgi:hypothetical protein
LIWKSGDLHGTTHERLKIWQKSYDLAKDLMQVTERFPRPQQRDGLASEIRQTALSLIRTVMLANSVQGTAVNQDLDQEIDYLQVIVRLEQMEAGTFDGDARSSIASWIGYTKHADCHGLNCQIAERHPFLRVAFDPVEVTE